MLFCNGCIDALLANAVTLGRSDVVMFGSFRDCVGKSILDYSQAFHLRKVDAVEKGIAVIKLRMDNCGGYCARGLVTKYWP